MEQDWRLATLGWASPIIDGHFDHQLFDKIKASQNNLYRQMGPQGLSFLAELQKANAREIYDPALTEARARYESPDLIRYGTLVFENRAAFFQARTHETEHAIQEMTCPAIHATPGNADSPLILAPRDFCLMMELMERAAASVDKFFQTKYLQLLHPDAIITVGEEAITENPQKFLPQYAGVTLEGTPIKAAGISALHYYHEFAITLYEQTLRARLEAGNVQGMTFVTLGKDNIAQLGDRLGISLFDPDKYSVENMMLIPAHEKRLGSLDHWLRTGKRNNLYTLTEELAERGMTPEKFLQDNIARCVATPRPKPD